MRAGEYLVTVTDQMRCKRARAMVEREMAVHIEEQKSVYISAGMDESEAELEAVKDMGDPVEAGNQMDRIHRPKMAWGMIVFIVLLSIAGFLLQYLMKTDLRLEETTLMGGPRQAVLLLIGFAVMIGICYADYSRIGMWARELTIVLWTVIFLGVTFCGAYVNGVRIWIALGGFSVNINMLSFLSVPLYGAILYRYRGQGNQAIAKAVLWMLPVPLLTRAGLSLWTALILCFTYAVVLSAAIVKNWYRVSRKCTLTALWFCAAAVPALIGAVIIASGPAYQAERLRQIFSPGYFGSGSSYITMNLWKILNESHMIGMNQNIGPMTKLPLASTDYTLLYVIAYYGFLAATVIVGVIVILFGSLLHKSVKQKNQMGMIMGLGCCTAFFTQILLYTLGNTGVLQGGAYCPFITYGGAGLIVTYALLGILLSIWRNQNIIPEPPLKNTGFRKNFRMAEEIKEN